MSNTTTKTPPTTDEKCTCGRPFGCHTAGLDATAFKDVTLWARRNGVLLHELTVGSVRALLVDTRAGAPAPPGPAQQTDSDARAGLYARMGGALLDEAAKRDTPEDDDDDDDGAPSR